MGLALATAVSIPIHHVGLINLFDCNGRDRDDPRSVRRRFIGVNVSNAITVASTLAYFGVNSIEGALDLLGIRWNGSFAVSAWIAIHTCLLFIPNIIENVCNFDWHYIKGTVTNITWVRNAFFAPICEELAFRACAGQLMAEALGETASVWVTPALFALCHLHLLIDDRRQGSSWSAAFTHRSFQVAYTYLFGVYAMVLFFRTRHLLAPIVCHSICNNFGLPLIVDLIGRPSSPYRTNMIILSFLSLGLFVFTFSYFTHPSIYQ